MSQIGWLHLSDLHLQNSGPDFLPEVTAAFLEDLRILHQLCGPWHLVFFTGDMVFSGDRTQYELLDSWLSRVREHLTSLGSKPKWFFVPGNHDLSRPDTDEMCDLLRWDKDEEVAARFWNDDSPKERSIVRRAFKNYAAWRKPWMGQHTAGMLPGDFSTSIQISRADLGIIGLNTTFLQLRGGDFSRRLTVHTRQLQSVCEEEPSTWINKHHLCILLTHQPPSWLDDDGLEHFNTSIALPGRFAFHLFGHMHETVLRSEAFGLGPSRRFFQAPSLCGLEKFKKGCGRTKVVRRHGYSAGRIWLHARDGLLRVWPRRAEQQAVGAWRFFPDHQAASLKNDNGTYEDSFLLHKHFQDGKPAAHQHAESEDRFTGTLRMGRSNGGVATVAITGFTANR